MKEKLIENQILLYARGEGIWCEKMQSGKMRKSYDYRGAKAGTSRTHWIKLHTEGTPDILLVPYGYAVFAEVKKDEKEVAKWERQRETDKRSAAQHLQHERIRASGGVVLVVCSLLDFKKKFAEWKATLKRGDIMFWDN